jgi:methyl-accepting chemotaxis protein
MFNRKSVVIMKWYYRLNIKLKIYLIALVAFIGFSGYFINNLMMSSKQNETIGLIEGTSFPLLQYGERSIVRFERIQETLASAVSAGEMEMLENAQSQKKALLDDLENAKKLDPDGMAPEIIAAFNRYYATAYGMSKSMLDGSADFSQMANLTQKMTAQLNETSELLQNFSQANRQQFDALIYRAEEVGQDMFIQGIVIGLITFGVIAFFSVWISRSISNSIKEVVRSLRDIAQENGDLTVSLTTESQDEVGELVHWFNEFVAKLRGVIGKVVNSAGPLHELSGQLNHLMNQVNDNLEHQRRSAQSSKDSVDRMQSSMESIVQDAASAVESADEANKESQQGQTVVNNTMASIRSLSDGVSDAAAVIRKLEADTDQVRSVLEVIKGIADQTNLLALNAAIEAARAGEQGRGFAVVADEVRALASKTQESTEVISGTIGNLISASQNAVAVMDTGTSQAASGVENSEKAGEALVNISEVISSIQSMNQRISEAVNVQQQVSEDIVNSVADILQQSNETADEAATLGQLASELNQVSVEMNNITSQFKI